MCAPIRTSRTMMRRRAGTGHGLSTVTIYRTPGRTLPAFRRRSARRSGPGSARTSSALARSSARASSGGMADEGRLELPEAAREKLLALQLQRGAAGDAVRSANTRLQALPRDADQRMRDALASAQSKHQHQ